VSVEQARVEELAEFLAIPSVSADDAHAIDVQRAGEWVSDYVRASGGRCDLLPTPTGHPLVVGEVPASASPSTAPTVMVYGHFDVQPAGDHALWTSDPFEPVVRDGWLYGRGTVDDKGNLFILLKAIRGLAEAGELPVNVRVLCDGEEEIGGTSVVDFLAADARTTEVCVIYDSTMPRIDTPSFEVGTRGLAYFKVNVRTGERDLHSGLFGGAALNALHALIEVLRAVTPVPDELKAGVIEATAEERESWSQLDPGADVLAAEEARPADGQAAAEFYSRTFATPAVDVNGITGGEPDLVKTVLPVEARANVSIRLAPGQNVDEVSRTFKTLLRGALAPGADLDVVRVNASPAGRVDPSEQAVVLARDAFERVMGSRPLLTRTGGTLPIVPVLEAKGIPTVLTGFGVPGHNMHGPNERLLVRYLVSGVDVTAEMFRAFGSLGA
jgi:acetylornithine deacetylase/succinyl-diaminopimelate desuccinylase-like protein